MKKYKILIIEEAENDIVEIYNYISYNDSVNNALKIVDKIETECLKLETFPSKGRIVPELRRIKISTFHEIILKPFRIIYQIIDDKIFVHAVLDSRRDLEDLLYNRLVGI